MSKRIVILARKNLHMSPGKLAAQAVHAALMLPASEIDAYTPVIVLMVTDRKFEEAKSRPGVIVVPDAGLTEVPPYTETVLAFVEITER